MQKMSDLVRMPDGKVGTIAEFADKGLIEFKEEKNWSNRGKTKYFADIKGTTSGWEIRKTAYLSRTGKNAELKTVFEN